MAESCLGSADGLGSLKTIVNATPTARRGWLRRCGRAIAAALVAAMMVFAHHASAAPPNFQAAGTAASGTGAVSPAWPAHAIGDIALLFIESAGGQPATLSTAA